MDHDLNWKVRILVTQWLPSLSRSYMDAILIYEFDFSSQELKQAQITSLACMTATLMVCWTRRSLASTSSPLTRTLLWVLIGYGSSFGLGWYLNDVHKFKDFLTPLPLRLHFTKPNTTAGSSLKLGKSYHKYGQKIITRSRFRKKNPPFFGVLSVRLQKEGISAG